MANPTGGASIGQCARIVLLTSDLLRNYLLLFEMVDNLIQQPFDRSMLSRKQALRYAGITNW